MSTTKGKTSEKKALKLVIKIGRHVFPSDLDSKKIGRAHV